MGNEKNFIHATKLNDRDLFFGPIEDHEEFIIFDDLWKLEDVMVVSGKFKSKGEAKRNGFGGDIPDGWKTFNIGKGKNRLDIFILK